MKEKERLLTIYRVPSGKGIKVTVQVFSFVLTSLMKELNTVEYRYLTIKKLSFLNEMSGTLDIRCLNQRQFHSDILDDQGLLEQSGPAGH